MVRPCCSIRCLQSQQVPCQRHQQQAVLYKLNVSRSAQREQGHRAQHVMLGEGPGHGGAGGAVDHHVRTQPQGSLLIVTLRLCV